MNACRNEIWQICLRNTILNYTVEVTLSQHPLDSEKSCHTVTGALASHADVLRGSSCVPAPLTSTDLSGKNLEQSHQSSRSGKCNLDFEKFRACFSSRKDQKGLMKGEDLTVLEQTSHLTQKRSY